MKKLIDGSFNAEIEKSIRRNLDNNFKIVSIKSNEVGAMHDNALFKGDKFDVFVKTGTNTFSYDQFTQEAWGLNYIKTKSQIYTPNVIDIVAVDDTTLLIMEAIEVKPVETKNDWEILGRGLATLHKTVWDKCGLETHSYLGIFRQDNTPENTWAEFFGKRRLNDTMIMAVNAGNMSIDQCKIIEKLIEKLPDICGPIQPYSLLHGDPWPGNLLYDGILFYYVWLSIKVIYSSNLNKVRELALNNALNNASFLYQQYDEKNDSEAFNYASGEIATYGNVITFINYDT